MTSSDNWFESWFDSPLYEQLYAGRDDTEAARLVDWISGLLPSARYPEVLDMGCGRGRHSLLLAGKGYRVTGVDLSPRAIDIARRKAADNYVANVRFVTGDMRTWQGGPFGLVCNLFTSFGYFENDDDNLHVIRNMQANLKDGGCLVMDYLNPEHVRRYLVPDEKFTIGDMACEIHRSIEKDMVVKSISFIPSDGRPPRHFQERVKLYGREWFEPVFSGLDMTVHMLRGDYADGAFDPQTSPRMVMVVRRG